ncbi:MAG: TolC family protein [Chloroflexi bacterium]|nr:TolC family protein [Chloroflexota bacterium]
MRRVLFYLTILGLCFWWVEAVADQTTAAANVVRITPTFVAQLAEEARTNNPALRAAAARVEAAQANSKAVRVWEDPMFMVGTVAASRSMRQDEGDVVYGVEQKLPLFRKPQLAKGVADAEAVTQKAALDYQFQMLRLEIARQLFKTALAGRTAGISQEDLDWLQTLVAATEERYRAGAGAQTDVLRMQNERSKRAQQLQTDLQQLEFERKMLNRLLNRDLAAPWPPLQLPSVAGPVFYNQRLINLTSQYEARLKVMRQEVKQAAAVAAQTRRQRWPDISLGAQGRQYSGTGDLREGMFTVTLNLPWVNAQKYRRDIERDEARLRAARLEVADYELFVPTEARRLTVQIDAARREAVLYRDEIIPRSELALASARSAWTANRGLFLDMMEARRMLLEARLGYARAVAQQYQMLSELALCCGVADLEALQMLGVQPDPAAPKNNQP